MMALIELFCDVDDFFKQFLPQWEKSLLESETVKRHRPFTMSPSVGKKLTGIRDRQASPSIHDVSCRSHGHCAMVSSLSLS